MPERNPTVAATTIQGSPVMSGVPNTGQVLNTYGGTKHASSYSGTPGNANLHVGGGRLDSVQLFPAATNAAAPAASGLPIRFYDSAVATSGGPFAASGHKLLAVLHPGTLENNTILFNSGLPTWGRKVDLGVVFTSGLCHDGMSGQVGWAASFTPVVSG